MKYCKHCGHSSYNVYDEWGFPICPHCGGEDLIDFEEDECIYEALVESNITTNTIADIADNLPPMNIGQKN